MPVSAMLGVAESKLWHSTADTCDDEEEEYLQALAMARHDARVLRIENLINRFIAAHDFTTVDFQVSYTSLFHWPDSIICGLNQDSLKMLKSIRNFW